MPFSPDEIAQHLSALEADWQTLVAQKDELTNRIIRLEGAHEFLSSLASSQDDAVTEVEDGCEVKAEGTD